MSWNFLDSKLIHVCCQKLGSDKIWKNLMRKEYYETYLKEEQRDKDFFEIKKSQIPNSGNGLYCKKEMKKGTPIGLGYGKFINDASRWNHIDGNLIQSTQQYEKTSRLGANVEYALLCHPQTRNYSFHLRLTKDLVAGEEVFLHYYAEQWIVMERLQPPAKPEKYLTPVQISIMEDFCIQLIGSSQKRALIIWSIYDYNRILLEKEKNKKQVGN